MMPKCHKNKNLRKELSQIIQFVKIISDENRLNILCLLKNKEKCVCEIWQYLNLPQNLVSHHLKVLKDFNLISFKKKGVKVFYALNEKTLKKYVALLNKYLKN